jgi:hypothetical protein
MQGVEVQRMANPFANRATKQTPHLPQPGGAARIDLEIDPSQTP